MGIFDFSWEKGAEKKPDEHSQTLGADASVPNASATTQGSVSADQIRMAAENANRLASDAPRRRGRPRKDAGTVAGNQPDLQGKIDAEIARQLDALHDPKQWEALLCFPADTMVTLTGRKHWDSSQREREVVGATGSALARTLMITNPRALAVMMFSAAMINFYMPRAILELRHMRAQKAPEPKVEDKK